jgi:glycosyltransferase involved in cell wall biosynthesis
MYLSLSIITTCKGRLEHLQQTLPRMVEQGFPVIVVDYDCPQGTAAWVAMHYPQVRVVRHRATPLFNHSHARNLGALAAASEYLLFLDADVFLSPNVLERIKSQVQPNSFFCHLQADRNLFGACLCPRMSFEKVGGYDEQFEGWGGEDRDLYDRLTLLGLKVQDFPAHAMSAIPHSNELRTAFVQEKNIATSRLINRLYSLAKIDLMRLLGKELPATVRIELHGHLKKLINSTSQGIPGQLHLPIRQIDLCGKRIDFVVQIRVAEVLETT